MLTLTPVAEQTLKKLIDDSGSPDGKAIRMIPRENGFDIAFDEPQPEDTTFECEEQTVLLLSPDVADVLDEKTMDVVPTDDGASLVLR